MKPSADNPTASPLIAGNAGSFANRAREFAAANQVVVTADTQRLVARHYRCEGIGALKVDGFAAAVDLYRVLHEETSRPPPFSMFQLYPPNLP